MTTIEKYQIIKPKVEQGRRGFPGPGGLSGGTFLHNELTNLDYSTAGHIGFLSSAAYTAADILAKLITVDGAASGLDADLLDGQHGIYYAPLENPAFIGVVTTPSIIINDITNGYVPYRVAATGKLGNSPIFSDGTNVGIGTTAPGSKLTIRTDAGGISIHGDHLAFNREAATGAIFSSAGFAYQFAHTQSTTPALDYLAWQIYNPAGGSITPNAIAVNGAGNVGIGTASPGAKLEIYGSSETDSETGTLMLRSSVVSAKKMTMGWSDTADAGFIAPIHSGVNWKNLILVPHAGNVGIGIVDPGAYKLNVNGTGYFAGNLTLNATNQHPSFVSGFQGANWQIAANGNAEFGNMRIRGGLSVYELIINQLHYQNGGLVIGAGAGKVKTISVATVGSEQLYFETPQGTAMVPFTAGAIVMIQRVDINRSDVVKKIVRQVSNVTGLLVTFTTTAGWATTDDTGIIGVGDEMVTIGHTATAALQNSIYFSATDADNPFMRVFAGVNSYAKWSMADKSTLRLQLGNLASIANYNDGKITLPATPGYGFYSDNAYLSGTINALAGLIGGFTISSTEGLYAGTGITRVQMKPGAGFWAGADLRANAPFSVTQAGAMTAKGIVELGTAPGGAGENVAMAYNDIWENTANTDYAALRINFLGYQAGITRFRSTLIGNGKDAPLAVFDGLNNAIDIYSATFETIGSINAKSYVYGYAGVSDTVIVSHDTQVNTTSTTYVKVKTITLGEQFSVPKTLRIQFSLAVLPTGPPSAFGRIYRGGVAVGTERSTNSDAFIMYSEDIAGWVGGQTIELWAKVGTADSMATLNNLRVCGTLATFVNEITGTNS